MEIIYQKQTTDEGNDCMIYKSFLVIRINGDCFLASKCTVYRGWMGSDSREVSFIFDNKNEALNWIEEE